MMMTANDKEEDNDYTPLTTIETTRTTRTSNAT